MALRTDEQINRINEFKKTHGEEVLPYESAKTAEELANEKTNITDEDKEKITNDVPNTLATELTKEQKEAAVREYYGITDLSDLVKKSDFKVEDTEAEIEAKKDKRENDKIAYGLTSNKFTKKLYEKFISDTKNAKDLVLNQYTSEQKAIDPELSDDEIISEFNSKFGLDQDEDSRQYKRGIKELGLLSETILKQNYGSILDIDKEFDTYEAAQLTAKELKDKILTQAPIYKQDVESIYEGLKSISIPFGEDKTYNVTIPNALVNALKEVELGTDYAAEQIKNGYDKEGKANTARMGLIINNLPFIIQSIADQINSGRAAGTRGIPPLDGTKASEPKRLTPQQQEASDRIYGRNVPIAN